MTKKQYDIVNKILGNQFMSTKQIAVFIILIGSVVFPLIMVCMLLQAIFGERGWEGSLLKNLLNELDT